VVCPRKGEAVVVKPMNRQQPRTKADESAATTHGRPRPECVRLRGAGIRGQARSYDSFPCGLSTISRGTPVHATPSRSGLARETHRRTTPSPRLPHPASPLWVWPECVRLRGAGIRGQARSYDSFPCGLSTISRTPPYTLPPVGAGLPAKRTAAPPHRNNKGDATRHPLNDVGLSDFFTERSSNRKTKSQASDNPAIFLMERFLHNLARAL
jgi:hypothetical protein